MAAASRRKLSPTFQTETELCAAFIGAVKQECGFPKPSGTWTCYAETAGWDILMAREEDGCQIGIEAKLDLNPGVIVQALHGLLGSYHEDGPDFRAVLIPDERHRPELATICGALGITVIRVPHHRERNWTIRPALPRLRKSEEYGPVDWHPCLPMRRHLLPDYVPDVAAGTSAPVQLSRWKVAALKLCALLEEGPVTRSDFKSLGISPTRWTDRHYGWLVPTPNGYVKGSRMPDFTAQHPDVYADIKRDREKWIFPRKTIGPITGQRSLGLENE